MTSDQSSPASDLEIVFQYAAIDQQGAKVADQLVASSEAALLSELSKQGLTPIRVKRVSSPGSRTSVGLGNLFQNSRIPAKYQTQFLYGFARLLSANIPMLDALKYSLDTMSSKPLIRSISKIKEDVENGQTLSRAFEVQKDCFEPVVLALVSVGERTNTLPETLTNCAERMDATIKSHARLQSALLYPIFLILMSFGVMGLIVFHLVPTLEPFFTQQGSNLPFGIGLMVSIRDFLFSNGITILLCFAVLALIGLIVIRLRPILLEKVLFALPLVGKVLLRTETAQFANTVALSLNSGASLSVALNIARSSSGRLLVQNALGEIAEKIHNGSSFSLALSDTGFFEKTLLNFVKIGERSDQLKALCASAGDVLEQEQTKQIDQVLELLTPILTIVIGVLIGAVVFSAITAITEVNSSVF